MSRRSLVTATVIFALVLMPAVASAWVIIVHASYPTTQDTQAQFAEAMKKITPPPADAKTKSHGPYYQSREGGGVRWTHIWDVDDDEILLMLDGIANGYSIFASTVPGFEYRIEIASTNRDTQRIQGKFAPK